MRHFCRVDGTPAAGERIPLSPDESRHLTQVLRVREGLEVGLRNGCGLVATARVAAAGRREVELEVIESRVLPAPAVRVTLVQAAIRNAALDPVLEKAVELGVAAVEIVDTERAVAGLDARDKHARWERVMTAAMKQSGNPWLPPVRTWESVAAYLRGRDADVPLLLCDLAPGATPAASVLSGLAARMCAEAAIAIGPEGDFTPAERDQWLAAGALPVSLGPHVLRSETAALLAAGLAVRILTDCREQPA